MEAALSRSVAFRLRSRSFLHFSDCKHNSLRVGRGGGMGGVDVLNVLRREQIKMIKAEESFRQLLQEEKQKCRHSAVVQHHPFDKRRFKLEGG